jgi:hypothetical protein
LFVWEEGHVIVFSLSLSLRCRLNYSVVNNNIGGGRCWSEPHREKEIAGQKGRHMILLSLQ